METETKLETQVQPEVTGSVPLTSEKPEEVIPEPTQVLSEVSVVAPVVPIVVPTPEIVPAPREIAYIINDKYFKGFEVLKSANGWWMDRGKVEELIRSFKQSLTIELACNYVGISIDQYKYFVQLHPDFSIIKERCASEVKIITKKGLYNKIVNEDGTTLRWMAEKTMPEEYPSGQQPSGPSFNNFGTFIATPVDPATVNPKVLERIKQRREQFKPEVIEATPDAQA